MTLIINCGWFSSHDHALKREQNIAAKTAWTSEKNMFKIPMKHIFSGSRVWDCEDETEEEVGGENSHLSIDGIRQWGGVSRTLVLGVLDRTLVIHRMSQRHSKGDGRSAQFWRWNCCCCWGGGVARECADDALQSQASHTFVWGGTYCSMLWRILMSQQDSRGGAGGAGRVLV